jgi:hypothetical protein
MERLVGLVAFEKFATQTSDVAAKLHQRNTREVLNNFVSIQTFYFVLELYLS